MTSDQGHRPIFETDQHVEWQVRNGDVLVLRYDRQTGLWTGEREQSDSSAGGQLGPNTLSSQEAQLLARSHDLRFKDGTKPS